MTPDALDAPDAIAGEMRDVLRTFLRTPSVSGGEGAFTRLVAEWAAGHGFEVDVWQADADALRGHPEAAAGHLPLAGRPTLVVRLPGTGGGRSLMFNAHADVVGAGDESRWTHGPWSGDDDGDDVFGRGACDVKGPLVSALWAMTTLARGGRRLRGDVLLELVPGEEDRVGLGTLTSVARGYRADASIVLEPTEGQPRCASRGGLRFTIEARGRSVHGTVKWLGHDAIIVARRVLDALDRMQTLFDTPTDDPLFASYPIARPITVDAVRGGEWQGMVCDRCVVAGYFELLPRDASDEWAARFSQALSDEMGDEAVSVTTTFSERYDGHRLDPTSPLCVAAGAAMGEGFAWQGFNAGCEAGLRPKLHGTPTLVWGPGSLAHAHAPDERVRFADVQRVAGRFERLACGWCD